MATGISFSPLFLKLLHLSGSNSSPGSFCSPKAAKHLKDHQGGCLQRELLEAAGKGKAMRITRALRWEKGLVMCLVMAALWFIGFQVHLVDRGKDDARSATKMGKIGPMADDVRVFWADGADLKFRNAGESLERWRWKRAASKDEAAVVLEKDVLVVEGRRARVAVPKMCDSVCMNNNYFAGFGCSASEMSAAPAQFDLSKQRECVMLMSVLRSQRLARDINWLLEDRVAREKKMMSTSVVRKFFPKNPCRQPNVKNYLVTMLSPEPVALKGHLLHLRTWALALYTPDSFLMYSNPGAAFLGCNPIEDGRITMKSYEACISERIGWQSLRQLLGQQLGYEVSFVSEDLPSRVRTITEATVRSLNYGAPLPAEPTWQMFSLQWFIDTNTRSVTLVRTSPALTGSDGDISFLGPKAWSDTLELLQTLPVESGDIPTTLGDWELVVNETSIVSVPQQTVRLKANKQQLRVIEQETAYNPCRALEIV